MTTQEWITWGAAGFNILWCIVWTWMGVRLRRRQERDLEHDREVHRFKIAAEVLRDAEKQSLSLAEQYSLSQARTIIAFRELEARVGHLVIDPNKKMPYPPS